MDDHNHGIFSPNWGTFFLVLKKGRGDLPPSSPLVTRLIWPRLVLQCQLLIPAWKLSKYGVIFGPYFPVFIPNKGKYRAEITAYLETFHAV